MARWALGLKACDPFEGIETCPNRRLPNVCESQRLKACDPFEGIETPVVIQYVRRQYHGLKACDPFEGIETFLLRYHLHLYLFV